MVPLLRCSRFACRLVEEEIQGNTIPDSWVNAFKELSSYSELYKIDALNIAKNAGSVIAKNTVLLGALASVNILPFKSEVLLETILENVPDKYKDINKKAFELGIKSIKKF
jgi:Pyruvate/2-oxoacid:ferredoxin oxidoreductase gamma subunit